MKKLYISCPMRGLSVEKIKELRARMHKIAEAVYDQELEVIDIPILATPPATNAIAIYNLGENIKKMASADYFIGVDNSYAYPGCTVEREIAEMYMDPKAHGFVPATILGIKDSYSEEHPKIFVDNEEFEY